MSRRAVMVGVAALVWAAPVLAQTRGTVEFGGFGSLASFDRSLTLGNGYGGGGRVGIFLDPRWSIEFENSEMRAWRPIGLRDVNVGILSSRLTAVPIRAGRLSFLAGAGAGIGTETNFLHSYGVNGLIGAKLAMTDNVSVRVDGIVDWLANNNWKTFKTVHLGVSVYRHPNVVTRTLLVAGPPAPPMVQRPDSVSAEEQARLRRMDADYRGLRDSLAMPKPFVALPVSSASALATMEEKIHFTTDRSDLTAESKATLDSKVKVFRANPSMRIVILGNTDERASDTYNMGLGRRRADAAKAYLVAQGIDPLRIEITSLGERNPTDSGSTKAAQAMNRRDEFRLLLASDFLVPPM